MCHGRTGAMQVPWGAGGAGVGWVVALIQSWGHFNSWHLGRSEGGERVSQKIPGRREF